MISHNSNKNIINNKNNGQNMSSSSNICSKRTTSHRRLPGFSELCSDMTHWSSTHHRHRRDNYYYTTTNKFNVLYENDQIGIKLFSREEKKKKKKRKAVDHKGHMKSQNTTTCNSYNSDFRWRGISYALWGEDSMYTDIMDQNQDQTQTQFDDSTSTQMKLNHKVPSVIRNEVVVSSSSSSLQYVNVKQDEDSRKRPLISQLEKLANSELHKKTKEERKVSSIPISILVPVPVVSSVTLSTPVKSKADEAWFGMLQELRKYNEQFGNCLVPKTCPKNKKLGSWVCSQRLIYKNYEKGKSSTMTPERIRLLNELGFVWEIRKRKSNGKMVSWIERFNQLVEYQNKFGTCNEIRRRDTEEYVKLSNWILNQRTAYKGFVKIKNSPSASDGSHMVDGPRISKERINMLESIGFSWIKYPGKTTGNDTKSRSLMKSTISNSQQLKISSSRFTNKTDKPFNGVEEMSESYSAEIVSDNEPTT